MNDLSHRSRLVVVKLLWIINLYENLLKTLGILLGRRTGRNKQKTSAPLEGFLGAPRPAGALGGKGLSQRPDQRPPPARVRPAR